MSFKSEKEQILLDREMSVPCNFLKFSVDAFFTHNLNILWISKNVNTLKLRKEFYIYFDSLFEIRVFWYFKNPYFLENRTGTKYHLQVRIIKPINNNLSKERGILKELWYLSYFRNKLTILTNFQFF